MRYPVDNAIFQWEDGERQVRAAPDGERARLERACASVLEELRRRLGSAFTIGELADLYGAGTDWAADPVARAGIHGEGSWVVDAAFARYAREATDFGGGRLRQGAERF